jgi:quercetin dioxygenase-like cupin family protein
MKLFNYTSCSMLLLSALSCLLLLLTAPRGALAQNDAGLNPPIFSWTDLVNTMTTPQVGPVQGTLGSSSVILSSMPAADSTLGKVTIAPCTTFVIHSHPRGNEQSMVLHGPLSIGYMFENGTFSSTTVQTGDFMVFPEGNFHYQSNQECTTAAFAISFPVPNPGTLPVTVAVSTIPEAMQLAFFGTYYSPTEANSVGPFVEDPVCVAACLQLNAKSTANAGGLRKTKLMRN